MKLRSLPVVSLLIVSLPLSAEVTINGFGSVVVGVSDDLNFRNNLYDKDIGFKPQSKFALQAMADLGENLSVTAQILAKGADDFDANFEWAYLSYAVNDSTTLRAGRLRIPFYRYSDYLDVGFAYPFISPPRTMYSLLFSTYDGVSVLHNFSLSSIDVSVNAYAGRVEETFFSTTTPTAGKLNNAMGINSQLSWQSFTAYATYMQTDVNIPVVTVEGLAAQLNQAGVPVSITDNLRINDDKGTFLGYGLSYDDGSLVFNAEKSRVDIDDSLNLVNNQWYVNLGYRVRSLQPYVYYGEAETDRNTTTAAMFPAPFRPGIQAAFDGQMYEFTETGLGIRWDFHDSAALKAEYTKYDDIWDRNAATQVGSQDHKESMDQFRVGIDFIF
ncbi:hypothetical protein GCM10009092_42670 [Bowmanella denitrificans]|uniref:Porin domain-containing protein n=1 Tax=Bowmanella denitrificans TaxID=366582 RepID=A0ABP3HPJ3_9ALTE